MILFPVVVAFLALAVIGGEVFTAACVVIGIGFGASWCLIPLQIRDIFGSAFGSLWGVALVAAGFGPLLMEPIDSYVWSRHAQSSSACVGLECYQATYVCASVLVLIVAVLCAMVGRRARGAASNCREDERVETALFFVTFIFVFEHCKPWAWAVNCSNPTRCF